MSADVLIVGQGLAGTLIGWELERAGVEFVIADQGHATAATMAAAGIINPVTGRRLVKTWRIDALLPLARATYQELGDALGLPLWRELRVRRLFADAFERAAFARKWRTGELSPFVAEEGDEAGFWIDRAARVDLRALVEGARRRWEKQGRLQVRRVDGARSVKAHAWVIDCTGSQGARMHLPGVIPWQFSKGELLQLKVNGLDPGVILNRRHWVLPTGVETAWVGATHDPGALDATPTEEARRVLARSAGELLGRPFDITGHRAGVRVTLPDKLPVIGTLEGTPHVGVANALGGKGALWAPLLAREWRRLIQSGTPVDPVLAWARFT